MVFTQVADRSAFRALLRLCRKVDRNPVELVTLIGRPPRRYDSRQGRSVQMQMQGSPFVEDAIFEACGATEFCNPRPGNASRAIRRHYLRALGLCLPYEGEAKELSRRFEAAQRAALEIGPLLAGSAEENQGSQFLRSFNACSRAKACVGDFLLTHPVSCLSESIFDQAVVLLESSERDAAGERISGMVLNKPTGTTMGQMLERAQDPADQEWAAKLNLKNLVGEYRLFRGGPILGGTSLQQNLRWLHGFPDVAGSATVGAHIWTGGDLGELARMASQDPDKAPLRFFLGHAAWDPLQLEIELECGVWIRGKTPEECSKAKSSAAASLCFSGERTEAWRAALQSAGLHILARFPRAPGADRRLKGHVERQQKAKTEESSESQQASGSGSGGRSSRR
eukprot:TRINITY_DN6887_c0_g1_i1.p1 TRINITY_DN6887_c0_g1~~TRINITY_DN6887_c0_g1_i1.p1  ORF type:complete len:396 (+),score=77.32 TRINITY_DN6887_c0_g1_i1:104-1291(+)